MELGVENHTILLLAGGQGLGKTSWLRNLVPPELRDYLFTGNVNPYSKGFPQMMVDCLLIVIDEMSGQSYADLNRLKRSPPQGSSTCAARTDTMLRRRYATPPSPPR